MHLLYPPRCISCGDLVDSDFGLCGSCWRDTPFIAGTVCESCGIGLPGPGDGFRVECDTCMQTPHLWSSGRAALDYDGVARKLVLALKHGDRQEVARPAGRWLAMAAKPLVSADVLVAPVPLHRSRLVRRRYNQSALLARAMCDHLGLEMCPDLLQRHRRTDVLDGKNREARQAELEGAISVHPKRAARMQGRPVLLVDDVMTSGATLDACSLAVLEGGASDARVLVLARVALDA